MSVATNIETRELLRFTSVRLYLAWTGAVAGILGVCGSLGLTLAFLALQFVILATLRATSGAPNQLRLRLSRLLIAFSAVTIASLAGELLLRIPSLSRRITPDVEVRAARFRQSDYDAETWTEWRGQKFRSRRLNTTKSADSFRILTLGDSFTWGVNIHSTSQIWPYVLEKEVSLAGRKVEVVNLSRPGNTTVNNLEFLETFGWDCEPDFIVLQYLVNDPLPSGPKFQRETIEWMRDSGLPLLLNTQAHANLAGNSRFYSALDRRWSGLQRRLFQLRDLDYADLHREGFKPWEETKSAFDRFSKLSRSAGIPVLVVMFPLFERDIDLRSGHPHADLHCKLREETVIRGLPFLDLLPVFAESNPNSNAWRVNADDSHPNERAHALAARAIRERVEAMLKRH